MTARSLLNRTLQAIAMSAALSGVAAAQNTPMTAQATVVTPLTVTKVTDLNFGTVYPGLDKIASGAQNSNLMGKFTIAGYSGATVNISFALPTELNGSGTAAGQTLSIDSWNGYQGVGATQNTGGTAFTPSTSLTPVVLGGSATNVWIGATVHPVYTQIAGPYSATLTMTTVYTGS